MAFLRFAAAGLVSCLLVAGPGPASAEEQTLNFKLVITTTDDTPIDLPSIGDRSLVASKAVGVAYFEDGRVAFKRFALATIRGEEDGNWMGLSTYTFENGDALNLQFTGDWSAEGAQVEYNLLLGTGAYEGVTGSGKLTGITTSWPDALLFDGSFTLSTPEN